VDPDLLRGTWQALGRAIGSADARLGTVPRAGVTDEYAATVVKAISADPTRPVELHPDEAAALRRGLEDGVATRPPLLDVVSATEPAKKRRSPKKNSLARGTEEL